MVATGGSTVESSVLWTFFATASVLLQLWKLLLFMACYCFFSWQQSDGSVQAHGTGVYEELACGLVSDPHQQLSRILKIWICHNMRLPLLDLVSS